MFQKVHEVMYGDGSTAESKANCSTVLLLLAHHCREPPFQKVLVQLAAFQKNYIDMHSSMQLINSFGETPEIRIKHAGYLKAEMALQSSLARWNKMQFPTWAEGEITLQTPEDQINLQKALAAEAKELMAQQRDLLMSQCDSALQNAMKALQPLSLGLQDGKSWKADIEAWFPAVLLFAVCINSRAAILQAEIRRFSLHIT